MNKLILSAVIATMIGVSIFKMSAPTVEGNGVERAMFNKWLMQNGKAYGNDDEQEYRFQNFKANVAEIESHTNPDYELGLNEFSDLNSAEFIAQYTGHRYEPVEVDESELENLDDVEVPASVDWVAQGKVSAVQSQGRCGSCWTFSATAAVESHEAIETGTLHKFSEQAVLDCGGEFGNYGCNGGWEDRGIKWAAKYGMALNDDYPYQGRQGTCKIHQKRTYKVNQGVRRVYRSNSSLVAAISKKVTTVALNAHGIQQYRRGVYSNWNCGNSLNHAVNAVGYGTDAATGKQFYKIRNSWGRWWGEQGYIRLERRSSGTGICGVTLDASYPY